MDKQKEDMIKRIIADLDDDHISEDDLRKALKDSNFQVNKMLGKLRKAIDREDDEDVQAKNKNIRKETSTNNQTKKLFKSRKASTEDIVNRYSRYVELPREVKDMGVERVIGKMKKMKELSNRISQLEYGQPTQQDEQYKVILQPKKGKFQEDIQNSIGSYNEYNNKWRVLQKLKKGQQPSIDLKGSVPTPGTNN